MNSAPLLPSLTSLFLTRSVLTSLKVDYAASSWARDVASSQFVLVPTHQIGHMLDLILGAGITVDRFSLKDCLNTASIAIFPKPMMRLLPAMVYLRLRRIKQELIWLERGWWHAHNEEARTSYKMFMKIYEMTVKVEKKDFYTSNHCIC